MNNNNIDENYIDKLKQIQKNMPNIVLPTMGLINNDNKININGYDYLKDKDSVRRSKDEVK